MLQRIAKLTVPSNKYQDKATGQQKTFYRDVGSIMENDQGQRFILLDKFFNPAAVPHDPDRAQVLVNIELLEQAPVPEVKPRKPRKVRKITDRKPSDDNAPYNGLPFDDDPGF